MSERTPDNPERRVGPSSAEGLRPADGCVAEETLVALLRDEVGDDERAAIDDHLAACETCRTRLDGYRNLVDVLTGVPAEASGRDLAGDVLARLPVEGGAWRRVSFRVGALAAAGLLIVVGWVVVDRFRTPDRDVVPEVVASPVEVALALDWLARTQEVDGSWDPAKWDGQPIYRVGLTGLALLAFLGADEDVVEGPHAGTVARAVAFLLAEQKRNGRFGPFFGASPYNHGIATVALLETYARTRDGKLKRPIEQALIFIGQHQDADGGWGYLDPERGVNTSVTAWQLHAVLLADALGWPQARPSAEKALAWIESTVDAQGRAGYSRTGDFRYGAVVPTAIAAFYLSRGAEADVDRTKVTDTLVRLASEPTDTDKVNFYRSYFLTQALGVLRRHGGSGTSKLAALSVDVRSDLVERQVTEGPHAGSWDPTDRWSPAGGRVYSTAMAALSLQAEARARPFAAEPR